MKKLVVFDSEGSGVFELQIEGKRLKKMKRIGVAVKKNE